MLYTENECLLKVENVSLVYDKKIILKDINFEIKNVVSHNSDNHQGQIIAFLGRSGRGKSSLFRLLTGLEKPSSGRVLIPEFNKKKDDGSFEMRDVKEGDVGLVDQKYTLFRHKTVYDSLLFALRKTDMSDEKKEKTVNEYLDAWGLAACKLQYPNELSGGQRQRTAIIEQILCSSNFIALDEPFSGLDVGNIQNVKTAFELIDKSNDLNTILFTTHDIQLAVELADTIYVIGYNDSTYGQLLKCFDLKKLHLAWSKELTPPHYELIKEIKEILLKS